jgi:putative ABC transport system ATP-binding protein
MGAIEPASSIPQTTRARHEPVSEPQQQSPKAPQDEVRMTNVTAETDQDTQTAAVVLQADALCKRVPLPDRELSILEDVSLAIRSGEAVAIVGASGSGKSTLLGLLAGLDTPSSGGVTLAGAALNALDEDGRAKLRGQKVGFVFQSFQLLPSLTALENVMLPIELMPYRDVPMSREAGSRERPDARDADGRARSILQKVGLGERLGHYPRQLSGGEQQRVALARAFVSNPAVLFADEPTGNLDTETGASIIEVLFDLNRQLGTTLVLVTHDEKLAARCDRILRLRAGRMVTN